MSRPTLAPLALLVLLTSSIATAAADPVDYRIAPVLKDGALQGLSVEIHLRGDADGETLFELPESWAGSSDLGRNIHDVTAEGATVAVGATPRQRVLSHRPNARLVLRYRVSSAWDSEPGFQYEKARPLILAGWFFFHGEGVFAVPDGRADAPVRFRWQGFPRAWRLASDLDHLAKHGGRLDDISESVAIGAPDLTVVTRVQDGKPLRVALRGAWRFAPADFADAVERIVRRSDALWGEAPRPFFIPLAPLGGGMQGHSYHGTGRGDAFSVAATPAFELAEASRFLAHEYAHTWFPVALGGHVPSPEARGYWFSEGVTDLYAARVLVDAGLWDAAAWVADLNTTLFRHAISPARNATEADIVAGFWSDAAMQKLPYDRGQLIALLIEQRLLNAGPTGLHKVLRDLQERAKTDPAPARDGFLALLEERLGRGAVDEIRAMAEGRKAVELPADLMPACLTVTTREQPVFHRGFDIEASIANGRVITGTDPALPAYAAGLRDGMRIVRREGGTDGDSSIPLTYHLDDAGTPRAFTYKPEGHGRVSIQQVSLKPDAPSDCAERLAGLR